MSNEVMTMDALKHTLKTQNEQGEALIVLIERMENQEKRVDKKIERVEGLVERVSKQITINYEEQNEIKSIVNKKANALTKTHLAEEGIPESENVFKAWKGLLIHRLYAKLKRKMNVVRYTAIKRENYDKAINYLTTIDYEDLSRKDLSPSVGVITAMEQQGLLYN